jgi:hypothetical protein
LIGHFKNKLRKNREAPQYAGLRFTIFSTFL